MDLVPESVEGALVFNIVKSCGANQAICGNCSDFAVAIHNWLLHTEIKYVIVDLQDEKEICRALLEEMLQLRRRVSYPFVFAGVMDKPAQIFKAYNFPDDDIYVTPEEAVAGLEKKRPGITKTPLAGLELGVPIASSRPRHGLVSEDVEVDGEGND